MWGCEIGVNSVKTATATVGVVGTALIFTPLAPIGVVLSVGSAIAGIGTWAGDSIYSSIKNGYLQV